MAVDGRYHSGSKLKCATTVFSGEANVTASVVYPVVYGLLTNHLLIEDSESEMVATFKTAVSDSLTVSYTHLTLPTIYSV